MKVNLMRKKYIILLVVTLIISIVSLSISLFLLLDNLQAEKLPKGVKQIEVVDGDRFKLVVDSKTYFLSLMFFEEYATRIQIKFEYSGYSIKTGDVGETFSVYDLKVTIKETTANSVILWIEKIEG